MDYPPRVYDLSLRTVGLIIGLLLLATHLIALLRPEQTKGWLLRLPRSRPLGVGLLAIDAVWTYWLVSNMDLGEFSQIRTYLQIGVPIVFVLTLFFVDEFLAVRALGIMALLGAEPILSACFLRPETARLLLVILAYGWLTLGLFWVGMPYLLRDQITWITTKGSRFKAATLAGLAYGLVVLACAVVVF
jgi:hypothetical protein